MYVSEENAEHTDDEQMAADTEEIIPKEPKKPIWSTLFQKKPKAHKEPKEEGEEEEETPQFGLNMIDRDEHNLNEHIKVSRSIIADCLLFLDMYMLHPSKSYL